MRFITRLTDKLNRNFQLTPGFNSLILKLYGGVRAYAIRPYTNSRLKKAETYARITCVYTHPDSEMVPSPEIQDSSHRRPQTKA